MSLFACLLAGSALADAEYEGLEHDVTAVHPSVWRDTVAVLELPGGAASELLPLFSLSAKDGTFAQTGVIAAGRLVPLSTRGYHPPADPATVNRAKLPVVKMSKARQGFILVIIDAVKGTTAWMQPPADATVTKLEDIRASAQLLFPTGRPHIDVYARPGDKFPARTVTSTSVVHYDVVEARDGFVRLHVHQNDVMDAPPPPGFDKDVGWIRVRDAIGIVFWPVNPDTC